MLILLTRHGESKYNIDNRIGGDSSLTENGKKYSVDLSEFQKTHSWFPKKYITSMKKRTIQTISKLVINTTKHQIELDEINAGIAENMTYEDFDNAFPRESSLRAANKLSYRYPCGESYEDLILRVKPCIDRILEEQENVFIVCHRAIIRALLYHLINIDKKDVPHIEIPLHQLILIENNNMRYIEV